MTGLLKLGSHQKNKNFDEFEIRLEDSRPLVVPASILAPPPIYFKPNQPHVIGNGPGVRLVAGPRETFVKPANLRSIMIIDYCRGLREIDGFKRCLQDLLEEVWTVSKLETRALMTVKDHLKFLLHCYQDFIQEKAKEAVIDGESPQTFQDALNSAVKFKLLLSEAAKANTRCQRN
ncbi:unnamed protein product [Caenorhabditis nigoni]